MIPPKVLVLIGLALCLFSAWRAYFLGWRRLQAEKAADAAEGTTEGDAPEDASSKGASGNAQVATKPRGYGRYRRGAPAPSANRHLKWGILHFCMGLFLVISTAVNM